MAIIITMGSFKIDICSFLLKQEFETFYELLSRDYLGKHMGQPHYFHGRRKRHQDIKFLSDFVRGSSGKAFLTCC